MSTSDSSSPPVEPTHDFDSQKLVHQKIRNDVDYDDWEYGTEPLPHEAWKADPQAPSSDETTS